MGLHGDALLREARDRVKPPPQQSAESDDAHSNQFQSAR